MSENQSGNESSEHLISTASGIIELVARLKGAQILAIDTEFIRESTFFPIVEIIQVATQTEAWLVDAQAFKRGHAHFDPNDYDPGIQPLLDVLSDASVLKIMHAAQGDQECLFTSFGVVATPSLDTAVAASLCGYGDGIGLGRLMKEVLNISLSKGHARTNWSVRPLPSHLLAYAKADVNDLVTLAQTLMAQLTQEGRLKWALELSAKWESKALFEADVSGLTQKMGRSGRLDQKGLSVLKALVQWREDRVRQLNLPRRWVADDHVLVDLARVQPKDMNHLGSFRGLNKGELRQNGETILKVIAEAEVDETIVVKKAARPASADELQVLELVKLFVGLLADQNKIAAKHLVTVAKLLPLLRAQNYTAEGLAETGVLTSEACALIGEEVAAMLRGKRSICVSEGRVKVLKID